MGIAITLAFGSTGLSWTASTRYLETDATDAWSVGRILQDQRPPKKDPREAPPREKEDRQRPKKKQEIDEKPKRDRTEAEGRVQGDRARPVREAVDRLSDKVERGGAAQQDLAELRQTLTAADSGVSPDPIVRERLNAEITALEDRAQKAQLKKQDLLRFQENLVDTRLDRALANLSQGAAERGLDREQLAEIEGLMDERAQLVKQDAGGGARAQSRNIDHALQNAVSQLVERANQGAGAPEEVAQLRETLAEDRVQRAFFTLERNALESRAIGADIDAVSRALSVHGGEDVNQADPLRSRLTSALEGKREALLAGTISPEVFEAMRANLLEQARRADKAGVGSGSEKDER
jgi:hypothetical protein